MELYFLYLLVCLLTVLSPGPGVIFTLSNATRFGFRGAVRGVIGLATGTFAVAMISASSLGLIITNSSWLFHTIKIIGALYLIFLGIKLIQARGQQELYNPNLKNRKRFTQGFLLQFTNPKVLLFFFAVFPQFISFESADSLSQLILFAASYSVLVIVVHVSYAWLMCQTGKKLSLANHKCAINQVTATLFILLGVGLAFYPH